MTGTAAKGGKAGSEPGLVAGFFFFDVLKSVKLKRSFSVYDHIVHRKDFGRMEECTGAARRRESHTNACPFVET